MKDKYQKYIATGLTAFCVIAGSILLFFLLYKIKSIFGFIGDIIRILEPLFMVEGLLFF